jgi:hypothetical protein
MYWHASRSLSWRVSPFSAGQHVAHVVLPDPHGDLVEVRPVEAVALAEVHLGVAQVADLLHVVVGRSEHGGDHQRRYARPVVVEEVEATRTLQVVEQAAGVAADPILDLGDRPRGEHPAQHVAVHVVARRVLVDEAVGEIVHRAADHFEDVALLGAVGAPVDQHLEDVLEASESPEVVLLIAVERRLLPHAPPDGMRVGVEAVVVGIPGEVSGLVRHGHAALLGRCGWLDRRRSSHPPHGGTLVVGT